MGSDIELRQSGEIGSFDDMRETDERVLAVAREAIDMARSRVSHSVYSAMNGAYWTIGKEISETTGERAAYGKHLIAFLSERLTAEYGKGYSEATLRNMRQFCRAFPIRYTLSSELSRSHYTRIMRVDAPEAREFYVRECAASN